MSQLISGAVGGKKAPPKAPVRRRQAPPPAVPKPAPAPAQSQAPVVERDEQPVAPPSPPQTQAKPPKEPTSPREPTPPPPKEPTPPPPSDPIPPPPRDPTPPPPRDPTPPPPAEASRPDDGFDKLRRFVQAQTPDATQQEQPTPGPAVHPQLVPPAAPMTASATQEPEVYTEQSATETDVAESQAESGTGRPSRKRKAAGASAKAPAKKQKKSSARSNTTVQREINEDGQDEETVQDETGQSEAAGSATVKRKRKPRAPRAAAEAGESIAPKRKRKPRSAARVVESDEEQDPEEEQEAVDGGPEGVTAPKPKKRRRKKKKVPRAEGEEGEDGDDDSSDPELKEIDPNTLSMFELTHYSKYGKVSEREKKMREINWDEVKKKRDEEVNRIMAGETGKEKEKEKEKGKKKKGKAGAGGDGEVVETTEGSFGTAEGGDNASNADGEEARASQRPSAAASPAPSEPAEAPAAGPQFRIVNGEIVVDETSLAINVPAAATDAVEEVIEEENDLTQQLNRFTYLNDRRRDPKDRIPNSRQKSDPWTDAETERFYEQLAIFGTDFDILSRMFQPKTRRHLKTKFNREEKLDPQRINDTLLGKYVRPATAMNLEAYAEETGVDVEVYQKYRDTEHAEEVMREGLREREEQMQTAMAEIAETQRQEKIAAQQKEQAKKEMEKKRKGAKGRKKGKVGAGTLGGAD